jgi:hypothetical protein
LLAGRDAALSLSLVSSPQRPINPIVPRGIKNKKLAKTRRARCFTGIR